MIIFKDSAIFTTMTKSIKFFLCLMLFFYKTSAQEQEAWIIKYTINLIDYLNTRKTYQSSQEKEYDGSPYLNENFVAGDLFYDGKYWFKDIPLRYNIYHDEMELSDKGTAYAIAPTHLIDQVIISTDTFVVDSIQSGSNKIKGFFKLLLKGKVSLLLKMNVGLLPGQSAKLYNDATPPKFTRDKNIIYASIGKDQPQKFRNINELIAIINDKQKLLSEYIKMNKLSSKNTKDFIKLASYYNSL